MGYRERLVRSHRRHLVRDGSRSLRYAVYGRLKRQDRRTRLAGADQGGVVCDYRGYSEPEEVICLMAERA